MSVGTVVNASLTAWEGRNSNIPSEQRDKLLRELIDAFQDIMNHNGDHWMFSDEIEDDPKQALEDYKRAKWKSQSAITGG